MYAGGLWLRAVTSGTVYRLRLGGYPFAAVLLSLALTKITVCPSSASVPYCFSVRFVWPKNVNCENTRIGRVVEAVGSALTLWVGREKGCGL